MSLLLVLVRIVTLILNKSTNQEYTWANLRLGKHAPVFQWGAHDPVLANLQLL